MISASGLIVFAFAFWYVSERRFGCGGGDDDGEVSERTETWEIRKSREGVVLIHDF